MYTAGQARRSCPCACKNHRAGFSNLGDLTPDQIQAAAQQVFDQCARNHPSPYGVLPYDDGVDCGDARAILGAPYSDADNAAIYAALLDVIGRHQLADKGIDPATAAAALVEQWKKTLTPTCSNDLDITYGRGGHVLCWLAKPMFSAWATAAGYVPPASPAYGATWRRPADQAIADQSAFAAMQQAAATSPAAAAAAASGPAAAQAGLHPWMLLIPAAIVVFKLLEG